MPGCATPSVKFGSSPILMLNLALDETKKFTVYRYVKYMTLPLLPSHNSDPVLHHVPRDKNPKSTPAEPYNCDAVPEPARKILRG
jgi:hypothetical protein